MSIQILLLIILVSAILLWISSMILWWQEETKVEVETINVHLSKQTGRIARYGRRGYYIVVLYTKKFIALYFPSIYKTMNKPNPTAGLEHGPTSYFLHSLSEKDTKK